MKKLSFSHLILIIFLFPSCTEKGVNIDLKPVQISIDTTYISTIETPQERNVLIEEFTGASCVNCPQGHETVAALINKYQDRVVAAAYHTFNGGSVFKPVNHADAKSKFDFRDSSATNIGSIIFGGVNSIPTAGVDRMPVSNSLQISRTLWPLQVENRLKIPTPVNLYMTSSYDSKDNIVSLKIKVAYTKVIKSKNIITIGITESGIIDAQMYPDRIDTAYVHNHIFRGCLTPFYGKSILDSLTSKEAGRVYEYSYNFSPAAHWKIENCKVIAVISNNEPENKEVLQSKEIKLK